MDIFRKKWSIEMFDKIRQVNTDISDSDLEHLIDLHFNKNFKDTEIEIYNEYENEIYRTQLSKVIDFRENDDYIINPSGVIFKKPGGNRPINLFAIGQAQQMDNRDVAKGEMYNALNAKDYMLATFKMSMQLTLKKQANSLYGLTNNIYSFVYGYNLASSITAICRLLTTNSSQVYESVIGDGVRFRDINEFFNFVHAMKKEKPSRRFKYKDVIDIIPTVDEVYDRMIFLFNFKYKIKEKYDDQYLIRKTIENLSTDERTRLYYKNNLRKLLLNKKISKFFLNTIRRNIGYLDPNKMPKDKESRDYVLIMNDMLIEFVYLNYIPFRPYDRACEDIRYAVPFMDTDSCGVYYGSILDYIFEEVYDDRDIWKIEDHKKIRQTAKTLLMVFAQTANKYQTNILVENINSVDEERRRVIMKNEFDYPLLITTDVKKSYYASMGRQESLLFDEIKYDIKGVSFFKSTATPKVREYIYEVILPYILKNKSKPDPFFINELCNNFRKTMEKEILSGDISYMSLAKIRQEYTNVFSVSQGKAAFIWNSVCDPDDMIELPDKAYIVPVKIETIKDLYVLDEYPEIYNKLVELFKKYPKNIGPYYDDKNKLKNGSGINFIAVPYFYEKIPPWITKLINYSKIIEKNMNLFSPINTPLNSQVLAASNKQGGGKYHTTIIKIQ